MADPAPVGATLLAQIECVALLVRLAGHLDRSEYEAFLALVTPDCMWWGPPDAKGHLAIRARLDARPKDARMVHIVTNTVVDLVAEGCAQARSTVVVYRLTAAAINGPVAAPATLNTLGFYDDLLALTADGWLLAERRLTPLAQASS